MKRSFFTAAILMLLSVCILAPRASAWSEWYSTKKACLNASGGREGIASVQWACGWAGSATEAVCALWIGGSNSVDPTILTNSTSGTININYYRMCYNGNPLGTSAIWVENDNGAINDANNMQGGDWAKPSSMATTLDIGKFISGISNTIVTVGDKPYYQYRRTVKVGRRSAGASSCSSYSGACSDMEETITLRIPAVAFQANASVSGVSTGYSSDNKANSKVVTCTNIDTGCNVSFIFYLKRIAGSGSTTYSIAKASANAGPYTNVATGQTFSPSDGNDHQVKSYSPTIKPGETICYRITFSPYGGTGNTRTHTVCAYGAGNLQASIEMKVSKDGNTFERRPSSNPLYVKPTDTIYLHSTYTPTPQYAANLKPASVSVVGINNPNVDASKTVHERFNTLTAKTWRDAFTARLVRNSNSQSVQTKDSVRARPGDVSSHSVNDLSYQIPNDNTGESFTATAITNANDNTRFAPKIASIGYTSNVGFTVTVNRDSISDASIIHVPYNFINSTAIDDTGEIVYAGEEKKINYTVTVGKRENKTVGGTYATIVNNAKHKLQIQVNGNWQDYNNEVTIDSLNNGNNFLDGSTTSYLASGAVPDLPAGTEVCFRSAIYPAASANDTSLDAAGTKTWAYSTPKCFTVAKRPSFQVLGGNIYADGAIKTTAAKKQNYRLKDGQQEKGTFVFGSWGELGVLATGNVNGLASGASYAAPRGSSSDSFCNASFLSFANANCSSGTTGNLKASLTSLGEDKKTIVDKLAGSDIRKFSSFNDFASANPDLSTGTILISNDNTIDITEDINYTGQYTTIESMPKVVIYANNININCNVTHLDAIIVANSTVNTCSDADNDNENDSRRSTQLTINGAVIANKVEFKRTYGAATGERSGIPAEIINFDPTLYLWGGQQVETDRNVYQMNSYLHELSPRL